MFRLSHTAKCMHYRILLETCYGLPQNSRVSVKERRIIHRMERTSLWFTIQTVAWLVTFPCWTLLQVHPSCTNTYKPIHLLNLVLVVTSFLVETMAQGREI